MSKSTHRVKVVPVSLRKHPNADRLREGVVVQPIINRFTDCNERVKFKWVGAGYLEKSK